MDEAQKSNGIWIAVLAVVLVAIAGYFAYSYQSSTPKVAPLNMSREELMKGAMVDGPGQVEPAAKQAGEAPKTISLKKGAS